MPALETLSWTGVAPAIVICWPLVKPWGEAIVTLITPELTIPGPFAVPAVQVDLLVPGPSIVNCEVETMDLTVRCATVALLTSAKVVPAVQAKVSTVLSTTTPVNGDASWTEKVPPLLATLVTPTVMVPATLPDSDWIGFGVAVVRLVIVAETPPVAMVCIWKPPVGELHVFMKIGSGMVSETDVTAWVAYAVSGVTNRVSSCSDAGVIPALTVENGVVDKAKPTLGTQSLLMPFTRPVVQV